MKLQASLVPPLLPLATCIAMATICGKSLAQQWNLVDTSSPLPITLPFSSGPDAIVYDSIRGVTVYYDHTSTWVWDGSTWLQYLVGPVPDMMSVMMDFDSARRATVICDGSATWEWDGSTWTKRFTPKAPGGRWSFGAAYDSNRGVMVLFGGAVGCSHCTDNDTWEYDGVDWVKKLHSGPSKRRGPAMCYDSARRVCVLFGGATVNPSSPLGDTWEWNGVNWKQVATTGPPARNAGYSNILAFDSDRGVSILHGGGDGTTPFDDTWEWDGKVWTQVNVTGPPPGLGSVAFDSKRKVTVAVGFGQTWEYTGFDPALSAKPQLLSLTTGGIQSFTLDAGPQFGSEPYLLLGSLNGTEPGIPVNSVVIPLNANCAYFACSLAHPNSPPLSSSFGILDPLGRATASFTVPPGSKPSLAGLQLHHAFVAFDTQAIPGAAVVAFASNAAPLQLIP